VRASDAGHGLYSGGMDLMMDVSFLMAYGMPAASAFSQVSENGMDGSSFGRTDPFFLQQ
jgi:hypothetical protein